MGQSVEPLFKSVPQAVQKDERLHEYLALVDAIRLGNQREAGVAAERLSERILKK
jgi:DNA-binding FadR family transcriptional regulator